MFDTGPFDEHKHVPQVIEAPKGPESKKARLLSKRRAVRLRLPGYRLRRRGQRVRQIVNR